MLAGVHVVQARTERERQTAAEKTTQQRQRQESDGDAGSRTRSPAAPTETDTNWPTAPFQTRLMWRLTDPRHSHWHHSGRARGPCTWPVAPVAAASPCPVVARVSRRVSCDESPPPPPTRSRSRSRSLPLLSPHPPPLPPPPRRRSSGGDNLSSCGRQ